MPKNAKSDREWKEAMHAFADSLQPRFATGQHPRCEKWRNEMKNILDCPKHKRHVSVSSFFRAGSGQALTASSTKCTCTYHKCFKAPEPVNIPHPTTPSRKGNAIIPGRALTPPTKDQQSTSPPQPKEKRIYAFGNKLPSIPRELKVGEMKESQGWIKEANKLDMYYFAKTSGKCAICLEGRVRAHSAITCLKIVWNLGFPYYATGVDMQLLVKL